MNISLTPNSEQNRPIHPKYRADIDGLRAIAVLSVVGFHAFPSVIKGGFIGVDIFFVISGFLISSIIYGSLKTDSFSFHIFYARRIRRIFPALILVLVTSYLFGWFYLFADEYKQLGKHIAGGAGFVSNFLFWEEAGYFDNTAETKPLLHLWSLGIEEQFYIIWPLLLWFAWKNRVNQLIICLIVIFASFMANVYTVKADVIAAFYSPLTRFWELICGSLLAYLTLHKPHLFASIKIHIDHISGKIFHRSVEKDGTLLRDASAVIGILLLTLAVLYITQEKRFPGWWALLPAIGTYLILSAGPYAWFNRTVLSNRLLVWFGLISYPLYLWHWPLLSFTRIVGGQTPALEIRIAAVFLSVVLAWLTYILLEKPIRFGKHGEIKTTLLCMLIVAIGYCGYNAYKRDGLLHRGFAESSEPMLETLKRSNREKECFDIENAHSKPDNWFCHLNKGTPPRTFVFGDSHVFSLLPTFEKIAKDKEIDILFTGLSGCPPLLGINSLRGDQDIRNCYALNDRIYRYVIQNNMTDIYLVARWTYYTDGRYDGEELNLIGNASTAETKAGSREAFLEGLRETVSKFDRAGIRIHIIKDVPLQLRNPKDLIRDIQNATAVNRQSRIESISVSRNQHDTFQGFVNTNLASINETYRPQNHVDVINLDHVYCNRVSCPFASGDVSYYYDSDHLSVFGALLSTNVLAQRF